MTTDMISTPASASRHTWGTVLAALVMLMGTFTFAGLAMPATAHASTMAVDQCNTHVPGAAGATTAMKCTVTVVNTINGSSTHSTTTVTRHCTIGPCSSPNGTFVTESASLVTAIRQCNGSDNDAAHAISCYVNVINEIDRGTPGAKPLSAPSANQCVGSGTGGGGVLDCTPASATGTTVTQCNGSGNGGGGKVRCTVDPKSRVSRAIPITITQCNGSGNPGGSRLTCNASVITRITDNTTVAVPKATSTPTATTTATRTTGAAATATSAATPSASSPAPTALGQTGAASTDGSSKDGLLTLGAGLVLAAAIGTLLFRRYAPAEWKQRFARKS